MGFQLEPTPDMGNFVTEVGRESFYIYGDIEPENCVEFFLTDIPKLRAALDQVEAYCRERR